MPKSLYSWEGHALNFEPRIWGFLNDIAGELYHGNRSRAVNSIILYSEIHMESERAMGRKPSHWLTAPAMWDGEQLESLLRMLERIRATGEPAELNEWWRGRLRAYLGATPVAS